MLRALAPLVRPTGSCTSLLTRSPIFHGVTAGYATSAKKSTKSSKVSKVSKSSKAPSTTTTTTTSTVANKLRGSNKQSPPAPQAALTGAGGGPVQFKGKKRRRATTNTMAMAARAHARQQRRLLGDRSLAPTSAREQVLAELYEQVEGSTIHVSKEEFDADPTTLSFDQLYRRILRTFEDQGSPKRQLLFEMLKRTKTQEDWDNFLIIAKVYQSKLVMLKPREASHLVHIAIQQGFLNQLYDEMQKNILFVYPTKAGYHKVIMELMKANQIDKVWKTIKVMAERDVKPYRETFKQLIQHFAPADVDGALNLFKLSSGLGVRTTPVEAYAIGRKLAEAERWTDILELEKIAKQDNPQSPFRNLISFIFINAHVKTGDEAGAKQLAQAQFSTLKDDLAALPEGDKTAYAFLKDLEQALPQLAA